MQNTYFFEIIFILLGIALVVAIAKYPGTLLELIKLPVKIIVAVIMQPIHLVLAIIAIIMSIIKGYFYKQDWKPRRTKWKSNRNINT